MNDKWCFVVERRTCMKVCKSPPNQYSVVFRIIVKTSENVSQC